MVFSSSASGGPYPSEAEIPSLVLRDVRPWSLRAGAELSGSFSWAQFDRVLCCAAGIGLGARFAVCCVRL